MIRYSTAHREDIKFAFRNSPASEGTSDTQTIPRGIAVDSESKIPRSSSSRIYLPDIFLGPKFIPWQHKTTWKYSYLDPSYPVCNEYCRMTAFTFQALARQEDRELFCFSDPPAHVLMTSDRFGNTSLHLIAALGVSHGALITLLRGHPQINAVNSAGQSFMHVFDKPKRNKGLPDILNVLQSLGFDFGQRDINGKTFVHVWVEKGVHWTLLVPYIYLLGLRDNTGRKRVLENGVLKQIRWEPLQPLSSLDLRAELSDSLHCNWTGATDLIRCLRNGSSIEPFISRTPSINARDKRGPSPLYWSVQLGDIQGTKLLLIHRANVHARDCAGRGVLATAYDTGYNEDSVRYGRVEACRALAIDAGAVQNPTRFDEWDLRDDQELDQSAPNTILDFFQEASY